MPWTTIQDNPEQIDEEVANFQSTVSSIDKFELTSHGRNQVVVLIQYTA